jgi:hypothetical protein
MTKSDKNVALLMTALVSVAATFRLRGLCNFLFHLLGDFQTQAKACGYNEFLKESLNLGMSNIITLQLRLIDK